MLNLGSRPAASVIDFTFQTTAASGAPTALTSGAVSVYKANSTTQSTTGVTLTANFDGVTGLNHVRIMTTDAFYAAGSDYSVVLTAGTVDSVSVVGATVATFRLESNVARTAGRTLYVAASGGSSSNPGTRDAPYDTIANAIAAAASGDTIFVLAGSHTGGSAITLSTKGLTFEGVGEASIVGFSTAGGTAAFTATDNTTFRNFVINQTGAGAGVQSLGASGLVFDRMRITAGSDSLFLVGSATAANLTIRDCYLASDFDGLILGGIDNVLIENSTFYTDSTDSTATSSAKGCSVGGTYFGGWKPCAITLRNCRFRIELLSGSVSGTAHEASGLLCSGGATVLVENCTCHATNAKASYNGTMAALRVSADTGTDPAYVTVIGSRLIVSDSASAASLTQRSVAVLNSGRCRLIDTVCDNTIFTGDVQEYISGIAGTIKTLDALDTAQDTQHATTQAATLSAAGVRTALGLASANLDTQLATIVEDTGTTLPAAIVGASGTVTAEDISPKRTWAFPSTGSSIRASNTVEVAASQAGTVTVCFDLDGILEDSVVLASITSTAITGTAATLGTAVQHTSKRKVNIPLTSITATAGTYTLTLTFVATDSEQYVVRGTLEVV